MITRKAAPALAAGCTVRDQARRVRRPFRALALADLARARRFPAGVLQRDHRDPQADRRRADLNPLVRKLSFTGSTEVGSMLMRAVRADDQEAFSMELGGNAPFIVFDDADLDAAVKGAMASKYRNTGQTCVCANRILVQDGVYDAFAAKLKAAVGKLKVGNGIEARA